MGFLSIRIEDYDGSRRLGLRRAWRRLVGTVLAAIPLGLGFIGVLTRDDRRGWADRRAGTDVVVVDPATAPWTQGRSRRANRLPPMAGGADGTATGSVIEVENPATAETIATVPELTADEVRALVAAARAAQPAWAEAGFEARAELLLAARRWLVANAARVVETICAETGRPADETQFTELAYGMMALEFWARQAPAYLADEQIETASPLARGRKLVVRYAPLGVIGVIGPWNFPLNNSFGDCIPALAAGNSVVLKPSEVTPLTSILLAEMLAECGLPEGVFQVATGRGETGAALVDEVDFVMFTGSVETGKRVMARAAETLTPVSLELGGKDPMIVLADADLERAANAAASYGLNNSGQVCISVERIYVEGPVHDEFLERLTGKVAALRQGPPGEPGTVDVGAIIFPPQLELIEAHVKDAVEKGARVMVGGERGPGPGRFYEPTVLADVDHSMRCMTEETFGPTLPVMRVRDAEQAVELANDGPYGLQASVWTRDHERGERIARMIEAGTAIVNDAQTNYAALELPMGGWKASGLGSRHGPEGIRKYTKRQSLMIMPGYAPRATRITSPTPPRPARRSATPSPCSRRASCSTTASGSPWRHSATPSFPASSRPTASLIHTGSGPARPRTRRSGRRSKWRCFRPSSATSRWRACASCSTGLRRTGSRRRRRRTCASRSSTASATRARRRWPGSAPCAASPGRCSTRCPTSAPVATRPGTRSAIPGRSPRRPTASARCGSGGRPGPGRRSRPTSAWSGRGRGRGRRRRARGGRQVSGRARDGRLLR